MKKSLVTIFTIALTFGVFAQQNDTMFVHRGQVITEYPTNEVDSIIFYRTQNSTPPTNPDIVHVTGITLNQISTISIGDTMTLTATVFPENASNKAVTWASSNPMVATVVNGKIFALSEGTAIIFAGTLDGNKIATCTLVVVIPVSEVVLNRTVDTLYVGHTTSLQATVLPSDATNRNVTWTSSNNNIATVDENGIITALSSGNTVITVTTQDGNKTATCSVFIIKLDESELIAQLQGNFTAFVRQSYFVDAYITREIDSLSGVGHPLWEFTFDVTNNDITALWDYGYSVVSIADLLALSTATSDVKIDAALKRIYALSVLLNYFGGSLDAPNLGLPLDANSTQLTSQQTAEYILHQLSEIEQIAVISGLESQKDKVKMLQARMFMNQGNFMNALHSLQSIVHTVNYQLFTDSASRFGAWTEPSSSESIWEGIPVGIVKKSPQQTYYYPTRYTETFLLMAEIYVRMGDLNQAREIINILRETMNMPPSAAASTQELLAECDELWGKLMFREGLRFADLKRRMMLNQELPNAKEMLPIPQSALNRNPNLTQNPGW
jgi:uncharacterized protein YjdB